MPSNTIKILDNMSLSETALWAFVKAAKMESPQKSILTIIEDFKNYMGCPDNDAYSMATTYHRMDAKVRRAKGVVKAEFITPRSYEENIHQIEETVEHLMVTVANIKKCIENGGSEIKL